MRKIGIGLAIALGIGVLVISLQPAEQRVEREAKIDAPLDFVMAQLQDFRRWPAWSPWENLDPNLDREYAGAPAGVGATYHWTGNEDVGEGRMRIVRIEPLRGNLDTRLRKLDEGQYDGIVLAAAGLKRLGFGDLPPLATEMHHPPVPLERLGAALGWRPSAGPARWSSTSPSLISVR